MKTLVSIFLTTTLVCFSSAAFAQAETWMPLDQGREWNFSGESPNTARIWIEGTQLVRGFETTVRKESISTASGVDIFENYWTVNEAGHVFLHGFKTISGGFEQAYDPPILYVSAPLELSKQWSSTFTLYDKLDGTGTPDGPYQITFDVLTSEQLDVPGGVFDAFGVMNSSAPVSTVIQGNGYGLLGNRIQGAPVQTPSEYWALNAGIVQFVVNQDTYILDSITPLEETTWGRLKVLFPEN